jgi:2-polyprenyl-3-methyl-5-hydroxy-6-metoxy-1,4-benzoquinol methylase
MSEWPPWACPSDGSGLLVGEAEARCPNGHAFPVRRGIVRLAEGAAYSEAFGAQWLRYRRTQLDSYTGTSISGDRARRCVGETLWNDLAGRQVLECGCGAGRFTEVLLARGARVTSIDLSAAVEANQANFPQDERHRVAQADILALPFPPRSFDVVFCLGVIQHTPDPERSIRALYEQVRPGGWLVLDHYSRRLRWWLSTAPAFRSVLKRLSPEHGLAASRLLVNALLPLHRRAGRAGVLVRRLSPVQAYYGKLPLSDELQREWALLDTHDALRDWHKHFRTQAQIEATLRGLGLVDIWCAEGGNGVEARGRRPVES